MTFADEIFKRTIEQIMTTGCTPERARPKYKDGTIALSKYITDVNMKFDISKGQVPITTLRPIYAKKAIEEVLWIYQDQTSDLRALEERGVSWWSPWALEDNTIGQRYGRTVANYDIVNRTLKLLEENPYNRRSIINLWQYADLDVPAKLPPCAYEMLFDVRKVDGVIYLDGALHQRSSDFLVAGLGINQIQYLSLQMMFAKHLGFEVGTFSWNPMNLHIYDRHFGQAEELLRRHGAGAEPRFYLDVPFGTSFYDITADDFKLENYEPQKPQLTFELAE
ncbi:MAG: thymidylate synthase [Candidatus Ancillula trichonymphae]|jgi:thymidylate synthase|nr:thymidylate synthase [Candidatus Ancillula trichonymphae]